jgi:histone H3
MPKPGRKTAPVLASQDAAASGGVKRTHHWRSGTVSLRRIVSQQKNFNPVLQRAPLYRVIRGSGSGIGSPIDAAAWQPAALHAIQLVLENEMIQIFQRSVENMAHAKRTEVMARDWDLHLSTLSPADALVSEPTVLRPKLDEEEEAEEDAEEEEEEDEEE